MTITTQRTITGWCLVWRRGLLTPPYRTGIEYETKEMADRVARWATER